MAYDEHWEQQKAAAVALVKQGHSFQAAGDATGVPLSTAHRAYQKLESGTASAADLHAADQALMRLTYAVATAAQSEQLERLQAGGVELRDANTAAAISLRAVGNYRRWNAPNTDASDNGSASKLLDRLEQALSSGAALTLSVQPRPPDADAIDVETIETDAT